jgi:hypothetical protein
MAAHHKASYPGSDVVIAGVANRHGAKDRVRNVQTKAPPCSAVLLLCADDKVYDTAFEALNIDLQSLRFDRQ